MSSPTWSRDTRDRWFYGTLALSGLSVVWVVWPFMDVLLFAAVTAAVASPLQGELTERLGGRRVLSALIVTFGGLLVVGVPLLLVLYRFSLEGVLLMNRAAEWVAAGRLEAMVAGLEQVGDEPWWEAVEAWVPEGVDPMEALAEPLRGLATTVVSSASSAVPSLMGTVITGVIDVVLFVFAVITLLAEGPKVLQFALDLTPLEDRYERRLIDVFSEFARNMVVGSLLTAVAMGLVAALGYFLAGVPRAMFFGVLTGFASFVPVVGTAVVVIPLCIWVGFDVGWGWATFLLVWSVGLTGTTDNVLRPLLMRGSSNIHPLLIFLAVFGGMSWMGVPGVLVGPVLVAAFLALATIFREDFSESSAAPNGGGPPPERVGDGPREPAED